MVSDSVAGSAFYGRDRVCALFDKRYAAFEKGYRQNLGIIGLSGFGKTSLLNFLRSRIRSEHALSIFIACRPHDSFERFAQRWMGQTLLGVYEHLKGASPCTFQKSWMSLRCEIPKTFGCMRRVRTLTRSRRYDHAYRELLSLSAVLRDECGRQMMLFIDDFDRIGDLKLSDPFSLFGKELMIQKETMYVVASSRVSRSEWIFREKLALLFGNFEVVELGPFDFEESYSFICNRLGGEGIVDEAAVRFLIRLTNGHPYYLDVFTYRLKKKLGTSVRPRGWDWVVRVLVEALDDRKSLLSQYWYSHLYQLANGKPWVVYADALAAIAKGHKKISTISRFLFLRMSEAKRLISRLQNANLVEKHGDIFHVPDPLLRFWLAEVYYDQRFSTGPIDQEGRFSRLRSRISEAFNESASEDCRTLTQRIEALFRRFGNEVVEINDRKFKCPLFSEVISRPPNGRALPILAENSHSRWFCQVLSREIAEEDVRVFLDDLKQQGRSVDKRLLIGIKGIELNAKLLAQETKIQYLDLKSLNVLMDLYNRPKVLG